MTKRQRILAVLHGEIPDCVPCCPDISNMVPARLTGLPFWDVYLFQIQPLWRAYIQAVEYFDIDGGFELYDFGPIDPLDESPPDWEERIVSRREDMIVTRKYYPAEGRWDLYAIPYSRDNPPGLLVKPSALNLPEIPSEWEPLTGVRRWPTGMALWRQIREELGEHGVLGLSSGISTVILHSPEDIYSYYDDPEPWRRRAEEMVIRAEARMERIAEMNPKPDFLFCGASGTLVTQNPQILRDLVLPGLKRITALAADMGIPTHVHSCGPERALVQMAAEETCLSIIDPLEIPPMGDCILSELKQRFGSKIVLKGNLHTTDVMLRGSADAVRAASRRAIDQAGAGGGFILSTGDQCGRDTPEENIFAMVETARSYGRY